jgi:hypothetical protein
MSHQIGNKNLAALGPSNSRQTRVKLAVNHYPATGPSNSRQTRVKLAVNHYPATGPSNSRQPRAKRVHLVSAKFYVQIHAYSCKYTHIMLVNAII